MYNRQRYSKVGNEFELISMSKKINIKIEIFVLIYSQIKQNSRSTKNVIMAYTTVLCKSPSLTPKLILCHYKRTIVAAYQHFKLLIA